MKLNFNFLKKKQVQIKRELPIYEESKEENNQTETQRIINSNEDSKLNKTNIDNSEIKNKENLENQEDAPSIQDSAIMKAKQEENNTKSNFKKEKKLTKKQIAIKEREENEIEKKEQFEQKKISNEDKLEIEKNKNILEEESKKNDELKKEKPLNKYEQKLKSMTAFFTKSSKTNSTIPHKKTLKEEEQEMSEKLLNDAKSKKLKNKFDKKKVEKRRLVKILDESLEKCGYDFRGKEFLSKLQKGSLISGLILTFILGMIFHIGAYKPHVFLIFIFLAFISTVIVSFILGLIGSFIFFDYRIFQRTQEIEEVLPEFLQLASANISAGMPIDRALWFAVRPKFGILAKEIEEVAKATMAGEDLEEALENFTKKYDSQSLREAMHLLIEGMRAGGEIGFLLNQIASNMQDIKIMRKEIAASIMSYVIFITAAAIVGAPFLLALSAQLLLIMGNISQSVQMDNSGGSSSMFNLQMSGDSIDIGDFKFFAVVILLITSIFSAMIISAIRKGNTTESIKVIPGFIAISLLVFFVATGFFGALLGGFFT